MILIVSLKKMNGIGQFHSPVCLMEMIQALFTSEIIIIYTQYVINVI